MVTTSVSLDVWIRQVPRQPKGMKSTQMAKQCMKTIDSYLPAKINREPAAGAASLGEQGRED